MKHWYEIYQLICEQLTIRYQENRENIGQQLYKHCLEDEEFMKVNGWLNKFQSRSDFQSMDPLHVFASMSSGSAGFDTRTQRMKVWLDVLKLPLKDELKIDFSGLPAPMSLQLLTPRQKAHGDVLWKLFAEAVSRPYKGLTETLFNDALKCKGVRIPTLTMFLFWVNRKYFLPLDTNTETLLKTTGKIRELPKTYTAYKLLLSEPGLNVYTEVASIAFRMKQQNDVPKNLTPRTKHYLGTINKEIKQYDFRILGMKIFEQTDQIYVRSLKTNHLYKFYNDFDLSESGVATLTPQPRLYVGNQGINISAIVGENGAGKSTLTELLYLTLYLISRKYVPAGAHFEDPEVDLALELYYCRDTLYRIKISGKTVLWERYRQNSGKYSSPEPVKGNKHEINDFFYTVAINYSLYGLNTKEAGQWLHHLFHKNDAYQVPIVLSPFRKDGNINVNRENELVMSRLLTTILLPAELENEQNLRYVAPGKQAYALIFEINKNKFEWLYEHDRKQVPMDKIKKHLAKTRTQILEAFNISWWAELKYPGEQLYDYANIYIIKKLISIALKYDHYRRYFNPMANKFENLTGYLKKLKADHTHVTFKLRQAINFLKYDHMEAVNLGEPVLVEDLSASIQITFNDVPNVINYQVIDYLPPSFLKCKILIKEKDKEMLYDFSHLSSGEKQRIYTVSSLAYHLFNINSVAESRSLIRYRNINILCDEVELYYHPEMQRTFIRFLLEYLRQVPLDALVGINIMFITHSPFLLSDIPTGNVLFMGYDGRLNTFGANIHELLVQGFFMKQTIGGYAYEQIHQILNFHRRVKEATDNIRTDLRDEYEAVREKYYYIVHELGEQYIRKVLEGHLLDMERLLDTQNFRQQQINYYEQQINALKNPSE